MSLPDLLSDNQFPVFPRLSANLRLVDVIIRVFDCVLIGLKLFEQRVVLFQCPFECSLAGDPTITPKRNNKVSNGFDQRNVVGLQERINFQFQGSTDCGVASHEDDGAPANQVALETLLNNPATGVNIEGSEDLYTVPPMSVP